MSTLYELGELDRSGVVLRPTPAERRALARLEGRLGVEWCPDGSARVYSRGLVGTAALSPHTTVSVTTKVPIANILSLASLAYHTLPIPPSLGDGLIEPVSDVVDWLALLLIAEIEALLAYGVRQDYVVVQDELPYVRGRLRFEATAISANRALAACEFADFVPDIPENRVLRAGLELLATQRLLPGLRTRVEQLLAGFQRVAFIRPASGQLPSWRITRLNRHYQPALELCRLLFDQAGASIDVGPLAAPAYFFPMEMVFQEGVTTLLRKRLPVVSRQRGRSHQPVSGTPARPLTFAADIVIGSPPRLVIDTKYAAPEIHNQYGGWSFHNDHVYQVVFYSLSLGCPAMLVYPRIERDVDVAFEIGEVAVRLVTVDLNQSGLAGLDALVAKVEELLPEAVAV
jgi:5-methylcytosine-specific restriction enzyme subunit McrC